MTDTYNAIADVADSGSLARRVAASAAQEGTPGDVAAWAYERRYVYAAAPGWGEAYAYAADTGNADPGADEAVITDAMILSQVQAMIGAGNLQ